MKMQELIEKYYTYAYSETKDGLQTLYVVAPGRKKEDFKVETAENILSVSFGEVVKSFELTDFVNQDGIKAKYDAGILSISLPMKEKHKPKEITVN